MGGRVMLEFLIAAVWMYRSVYFPIVVVVFLLAGMGAPRGWTVARWLIVPGYYLGVIFWSMAFIPADWAPSSAVSQLASARIPQMPHLGVAPGR